MKRRLLLREPISVALETLRVHKLRSFLMLLGIILSVSTLIVVIALIAGVNRYIADRVANLGSNVFLVARFPLITDVEEFVKANRRNKIISWADFEALRDNLKLPSRVGAEVRTSGKVRSGSQSLEDTSIRGVTANMGEIDVEEPIDGRYLSDGDDQNRAMVTTMAVPTSSLAWPSRSARCSANRRIISPTYPSRRTSKFMAPTRACGSTFRREERTGWNGRRMRRER